MKEFAVTHLAKITGGTLQPSSGPGRTCSFTGVSTDSRTIEAGDCFFAIPGQKFDGHDYLCEVFAKGAVCAVVSRKLDDEKLAGKCLLQVEDTIKALGDLAAEYRRQANFKVVAITGSVGKTTTRQIIYHVLSRHFQVHQSPGSFNNNIGLPLTLLGAKTDDQIVITELGSNHPGEIPYLTRIAQPNIAVVTNVHPAHLEGFGDLRTIVHEKLSISEGLTPGGILIINADFEQLVDACRAKGADFVTFGKSDGSDYQAGNIHLDGRASRFAIDGKEVHLPLPGQGNVENALAAWAVCSRLGLTTDDFASAIKTLPPVSMRAELLQIGTLTVLSDCYNANPGSMRNALEILAGLDPTGKRRSVFICGDMAELGKQAEQLHVELGAAIARSGVQLMLAVGKLATIAARSAEAESEHNLQAKCFADTISARNNLNEFIKDYDIILIKGSRTAKLEMVVERLKELFSYSGPRELTKQM
jgi:UDP-N-acetylmuramoyl-tripeptide--D-alanyl-D-alanine ligase